MAIASEIRCSSLDESAADSFDRECGNAAGDASVVIVADDDIELLAAVGAGEHRRRVYLAITPACGRAVLIPLEAQGASSIYTHGEVG